MADEYRLEKVYEWPGMRAEVWRPILTPEERERRMNEIKKAAAALLWSIEEKKYAQRDG